MRKILLGLLLIAVVIAAWMAFRVSIDRQIRQQLFVNHSPDAASAIVQRWEMLALYPGHWKWYKAEIARQQNDFPRLKRFTDEGNESAIPAEQANGPLWLFEASAGAITNARSNIAKLLVLYGKHSSEVFAPIVQGLVVKGNLLEANNMVRMWGEHVDKSPEHVFWKGIIAASSYDLPKATEHFQQAVEWNPNYEAARAELADLLLEQVQLEEAKIQFEWLVKKDPEKSRYITGYARTLLNLGYPDEATQQLAKLKDVLQASSIELALVCETELEAGNAARALELAKVLVERWPNAVSYLELASRCEAKLGNEDKSQDYAARASASQNRRPEVDQLITELDTQKQNQVLRRKMAELMMTYVDPAAGAGYLEVVVRATPSDLRAHQLLTHYFQQEQNLKRAEIHSRIANQLAASIPKEPSEPVRPPLIAPMP